MRHSKDIRIKSGRRADLNDRYFRSSWEANYARYLNWLIKQGDVASWDFECDTFEFPVKRGSMFYTPDFKVTLPDGSFSYHEVKGYMDKRSATKLRRMAKYYPTIKLFVIDTKVYRGIEKGVGPIIPTWERQERKHRVPGVVGDR